MTTYITLSQFSDRRWMWKGKIRLSIGLNMARRGFADSLSLPRYLLKLHMMIDLPHSERHEAFERILSPHPT